MKATQLITAILAIINKASVADKLHNSTSAEHWLATGTASSNIKLEVDDNILVVQLVGVDTPVKIPLPTLQVLGSDAIDRLAAILASTVWLAMSKATGQGSERYTEFSRLLAPIAASCMSPVQQVYQHKLLTGETASRTVTSKNPADYITSSTLLGLIREEEVSFSVYGGVITLIGRNKELKDFLSDDGKELTLEHEDGSTSIERKGVMMTIKYRPVSDK